MKDWLRTPTDRLLAVVAVLLFAHLVVAADYNMGTASSAGKIGTPALGQYKAAAVDLSGGTDGNWTCLQFDPSGGLQLSPRASGVVVAAGANVAAAANNQTLAAAAGKTTYLTGFAVSGLGATAASGITITSTGLANNLNFVLPIPAGVTVGVAPLVVTFNPPLPASAANTAIVIQVPSFGAGNTTASASAWGFQL